MSEGAVRVLLAPAFASSFEAVVRSDRDFACRADICEQVHRSKRGGHSVFTYGSGEPQIRFTSTSGIVVVDSTNRLPAQK
jgi:hypothetical protein